MDFGGFRISRCPEFSVVAVFISGIWRKPQMISFFFKAFPATHFKQSNQKTVVIVKYATWRHHLAYQKPPFFVSFYCTHNCESYGYKCLCTTIWEIRSSTLCIEIIILERSFWKFWETLFWNSVGCGTWMIKNNFIWISWSEIVLAIQEIKKLFILSPCLMLFYIHWCILMEGS